MLTIEQVAELFNVSKSSMYRLIDSRKIPCYKIGGLLRFTEDDINTYLEEHRINIIK